MTSAPRDEGVHPALFAETSHSVVRDAVSEFEHNRAGNLSIAPHWVHTDFEIGVLGMENLSSYAVQTAVIKTQIDTKPVASFSKFTIVLRSGSDIFREGRRRVP